MSLRNGRHSRIQKTVFTLTILYLISALFLQFLQIPSSNHIHFMINSKQSIYRGVVSTTGFGINVISEDGAFDGYNLFVVHQGNKENPEKNSQTLVIYDMDGKLITKRNVGTKGGNLGSRNVKFINSTTLLMGENLGADIMEYL